MITRKHNRTPAPQQPTAAETYATRRNDIARLMDVLQMELDKHDEQAKADRSAVRKLYLDYKSAREKAASSEAAWKKLMEDALAKADPAAAALAEKEKAAFRARMESSRKSGKSGAKVAAGEDDEEDGGEG